MEAVIYPKWRYSATLPAVIVNNADEDAALGAGWEDTPAAFDPKPEPKPKPVAPKPPATPKPEEPKAGAAVKVAEK